MVFMFMASSKNKKAKKLVTAKTSRGIIKNWYSYSTPVTYRSPSQQRLTPSVSLDKILKLFEDPTVNNAITTSVNAILKPSFKVISKDDLREAVWATNTIKSLRFTRLLRSVLFQAFLFGNSFVEIVQNKNTGYVKELHLLEATEMEIETDAGGHGEVIGYWQNHNGQFVWFEPKEVWHFSTTHVTTNLWGFVNTKAIYDLVDTKKLIEEYIQYLFKYNKFAKAWSIKNGNTKQVEVLIEGLKARRDNPLKEMVVEGEVGVIEAYSVNDIPVLVNYLRYIESQIRQLLLLPPIVGGQQEGANRSSAETQFRGVFGTNLRSIQLILEEEINNELFPKMGFKKYIFKFNPIDKYDEREAIQNAIYLKGLGFNAKTIHEYLKLKGVQLPDDAEISEVESDSNIVKHETQNKKSVSRMPKPDNILNRDNPQDNPNSNTAGIEISTS